MISWESWCLFLARLERTVSSNITQSRSSNQTLRRFLSSPHLDPFLSPQILSFVPSVASIRQRNHVKTNSLTLFPEELQKASPWHDMKSDSFWWNLCMCQAKRSDHVISEHIQGERQICGSIFASDTSVKNKITYIAMATVCIVFSLSRAEPAQTDINEKLVECLLTSVSERLSNLGRGGITVLGPLFSILSSSSFSHSHTWLGIEEER